MEIAAPARVSVAASRMMVLLMVLFLSRSPRSVTHARTGYVREMAAIQSTR